MTPGALRDWIPAPLHAELDAVRPVADRLRTCAPSPYAGVWPSHVLAAIAEREVAPWLGCALFLRADPLGGGALRLVDEARDDGRHAVLLADLSRRFGAALDAPLRALPGALRPERVRRWLDDGAVDARIAEAEAARAPRDAVQALLSLWRDTGDPLVADTLDVLDAAGRADGADAFAALWDTLRVARPSTVADAARGLADPPYDPRGATCLRAALLTRTLARGMQHSMGGALLTIGDVRGLPRLAWSRDLTPVTAPPLWPAPLGPAARARLYALARNHGRSLSPPPPMLRAAERACAAAPTPLARAVLADARLTYGYPAPADGPLERTPAVDLEAVSERPYGMTPATAVFEGGLVVQAERTDAALAALDPAWHSVERLVVDTLDVSTLVRLPRLRALELRMDPPPDLDRIEAFARALTEARGAPVEALGDARGLFGLVPGPHTAVHTRGGDLLYAARSARCAGLAIEARLDELPATLDAAPPTLERLHLCQRGTPFWNPMGWLVEVDVRARTLVAVWHGLQSDPRAPWRPEDVRRAGRALAELLEGHSHRFAQVHVRLPTDAPYAPDPDALRRAAGGTALTIVHEASP